MNNLKKKIEFSWAFSSKISFYAKELTGQSWYTFVLPGNQTHELVELQKLYGISYWKEQLELQIQARLWWLVLVEVKSRVRVRTF